MNVSESLNVSDLLTYLKPLVDYWFYTLPVAFFLWVAANYVEKFAIALIGFIAGINFIFPFLMEKFPQLDQWLTTDVSKQVAMVILGILVAAIIYALYRAFVFIAGFLILGIIGYYVIDFVVRYFSISFPAESGYFIFGGAILFGIIGGFFAARKSTEIVSILSIIVGSAVISSTIIAVIIKYIIKSEDFEKTFSQPVYSSIFVGLLLVFIILGFVINFGKRKGKERG
ncbi:hypothetical protein JYK00_05845 [Thermosipho ferrireducens]|uniref:DUF4203 domain-containing protein n=1 Tax=Thermosipho ferrireducens TaxID=2571116 RepID=A0ABX7S687_9BACT|nr:hypothetical protein [Thermosipho ferrireducens]QTA37265.1 hypothetical protein JYK00_05845 [Thermosipho ferrireducens]